MTWIFEASVDAQGGAYATGVLVLMSSACVADGHRRLAQAARLWLRPRAVGITSLITVVFVYTTIANVIEKPDGIKIASFFILAIIVTSFVSRVVRSTELRFTGFDFADDRVAVPVGHASSTSSSRSSCRTGPAAAAWPRRKRTSAASTACRPDVLIVFVEVELGDASDFYQTPLLEVIRRKAGSSCASPLRLDRPHARGRWRWRWRRSGKPPEIHFGWTDESPLAANLGFLLFGEGNVPWMVRELIVKAEPDPKFQPRIVIG